MAPKRSRTPLSGSVASSDRGPPFALDGRDVPAVGRTDRVCRHGARFGRRDERLGSHPRATLGNVRAPKKMIWTRDWTR